MKAQEASSGQAVDPKDELLSDIFHGLSQPLTTLECGLELGLRYDTTVAQFRNRLSVLLEAARVMHQQLVELRALQQERRPGACEMQNGRNSTNYSQ